MAIFSIWTAFLSRSRFHPSKSWGKAPRYYITSTIFLFQFSTGVGTTVNQQTTRILASSTVMYCPALITFSQSPHVGTAILLTSSMTAILLPTSYHHCSFENIILAEFLATNFSFPCFFISSLLLKPTFSSHGFHKHHGTFPLAKQ